MSDAIIKRESPVALAPTSFDEARSFAATLAKAEGFVPRSLLGRPHAILACIMTGAEMGMGPMQSLRTIHMVDGKPLLAADAMLARAIERGVRPEWLETTERVARLRLERAGFKPHEHTYTIEEAERAGLARKNNWRSYAPAMLRARCLSAAIRAYCPDVLGAGVYVEGEIGDEPRREDVRIEVQPSEAQPMDEQIVEAEYEAACASSYEGDGAPPVERPRGHITCPACNGSKRRGNGEACDWCRGEGTVLPEDAPPEEPRGEAVCAAPDEPAELTWRDCRTAEDVQAFLSVRGPGGQTRGELIAAAPTGKLERLIASADKQAGVAASDVRRWCGLEPEAAE